MRQFTNKEKKLISALIDYAYSSNNQCFLVWKYIAEQKIYQTRDLLTIVFLLWLLEDNGYVYISQSSPNINPVTDVNIKRTLNGLYDSLRGRVEDLLSKDIFVTDQLRDLRDNSFQSLEAEQLNLTKQLLDNALNQTNEAIAQTQEAFVQTGEAKKQTKEALRQSEESKRQTHFAFGTLVLSLLTFLASLFFSLRSASSAPLMESNKYMKDTGSLINAFPIQLQDTIQAKTFTDKSVVKDNATNETLRKQTNK